LNRLDCDCARPSCGKKNTQSRAAKSPVIIGALVIIIWLAFLITATT
jgi:hypothetical protein